MSRAKYIKVDTEELTRRREQDIVDEKRRGEGSKFPPVSWMKIDAGQRRYLRIMPPWTDEGVNAYMPSFYFAKHWKVGPAMENYHICPRKMSLERNRRIKQMPASRREKLGLSLTEVAACYTCEQVDDLFNSPNELDQNTGRRQKSGHNYLYQVIDRDDPVWRGDEREIEDQPEYIGKPKVQFLRLPRKASAALGGILDNPADFGMVTDPYEGQVIIIERRGEGIDTEYGPSATGKFGPIFTTTGGEPDEEMIDAALNAMFDLDGHPFFRIPTYDETYCIYNGLEMDSAAPPNRTLRDGAHATKSLPPAASNTSADPVYDAFIANAQRGRVLSREQLAAENGWEPAQVPGCYAVEPDHKDSQCAQKCNVQDHCSRTFFEKMNKYSTNAPEQRMAPAPSGKSISAGKGSYSDSDVPF